MKWRTGVLPEVAPEERPRLVVAMTAFACAASAALVARTAGNALFLTRIGSAHLTAMYAAAAAALLLSSVALGWLTARREPGEALLIGAGALVLATLGARAAASTSWPGGAVLAYIVGELDVKLPGILFWSYAALLFNPREAKRLYVLVGLGGTVACIASGALVGRFSRAYGVENLLVVAAAILLLFAVVVWRHAAGARSSRTGPGAAAGAAPPLRSVGDLLGLEQVRHMVLLVTATTATLLVADFLFMSAARSLYRGPELAAFLGRFYALAGIGTLLFQLFVVHQVMRRGGVLVAALALPATLFLAACGIAATGGFGWIVAAKAAEPLVDYTLNAAALQLFYLAVRRQSRSQARTLLEGFARPAAALVTGLLLTEFVSRLVPSTATLLVAGGSLAWMLAAAAVHRSYVASLVASIGARRLDISEERFEGDRLMTRQLKKLLETASDEDARYVLDVFPGLAEADDFAPQMRRLLGRSRPDLKVAALEFLGARGGPADARAVAAELAHPAPEVRRAAVLALAELLGADAAGAVHGMLRDTDPGVRAAATSALFTVGDLWVLMAACESLDVMLRSEDAAVRAAATLSLAHVRLGGLDRMLETSLADPDPRVKRAAVETCAARPSPRLVPALLHALGDPRLAPSALDALAPLGEKLFPLLHTFREEAKKPTVEERWLRVPALLARVGGAEALEMLRAALDAPNMSLRRRAVAAYVELVRTRREGNARREELTRAALAQVTAARERAVLAQKLGSSRDLAFLTFVLHNEKDRLLHNTLMLLGLLHPSLEMSSLFWVITSGTPEKRAEAIELLDNVVTGPVRPELLGYLEAPATGPVDEDAVSELLAGLLHAPVTEWALAGAAYPIGRREFKKALPWVKELLDHASELVRETALDAFSKLAEAGDLKAACQRLRTDPAPHVRQLAVRLSATAAHDRIFL